MCQNRICLLYRILNSPQKNKCRIFQQHISDLPTFTLHLLSQRHILKIKLTTMKISNSKILIIDDNDSLLEALEMFLSPHFGTIKLLKSPETVLSLHKKCNFDIILLDMNFRAGINSGNEGIYWMHEILKQDPLATIIMITAYGDVELAVKTIKEGAADFIQKSWDESKILSTLIAAYKNRLSKLEIKILKQKQTHLSENQKGLGRTIIGESPSMMKMSETINKVSGTDANILLLGENGTGKEVIAREIHRKSKRSQEIFVNVDLGSLSENLFESELFGYRKGSFTGAISDRTGRFEIASGGTLFLDEIANIPLSLQSKLLSVIQNREIIPIGACHPVPINVRLICATNADINFMVNHGTFREDLLYRINTIQLTVPPLRERIKDIALLAMHFVTLFSEKYNKNIEGCDTGAINELETHHWKGNVRELEHMIEKAVILCDKPILTKHDFTIRKGQSNYNLPMDNFNISDHEKEIIARAINFSDGNYSKAANKLGINRSTLYEKIKKYEL
jgi:DNA-binding NtrC family response regulator